MVLLNMMIGRLDILIGLTLLIIIIVIEGIFLSKRLFNKLIDFKTFLAIILANLSSTLLGFLGLGIFWRFITDRIIESLQLNIDHTSIVFTIGYFLFAFLLTLLIEIPINLLVLKTKANNKDILIGTIYANILTYILLGILTNGMI